MGAGRAGQVAPAVARGPASREAVSGPGAADAETGPWWRRFSLWFPVLAYAATRAVDAVYFAVFQRAQIALEPGIAEARVIFPLPAAPGYWPVLANWDGQWYQEIAVHGYPTPLPVDPDTGRVDQNAWAFYPVFPLLTRALMWLTGGSFPVVGSTLSLVLGGVAMVLLFRLVDRAVGRWSAIVATVATTTWVAAPVLQTAYTEATALLGVVVLLTVLRGRRYAWVAVCLVVLALTRNVVLVAAPALIAHGVVRYARRTDDPFPLGERVVVAGLAAASVVLTFLWPTLCRVVTGDPQGYEKTMAGWGVQAFQIKLPTWVDYLYYDYGYRGWALAFVLVVAFAAVMLSPVTTRWGPELWGWAGAYPAYQVLVTGIGPSRIRYFLLAWPVFLLLAWLLDRPWWRRWRAWLLVAWAAGFLALQGWWVWNYWVITDLRGDLLFP